MASDPIEKGYAGSTKGVKFSFTELLTNPNVSVQTTKSIAGHVSQRMVDRYAHIRLEAKRSALER